MLLCLFAALFTLKLFPDKPHHLGDFLRGHFVLERRHFLLAVGDHLRDFIVGVLEGVFGLQRWNFDLFVVDLHESAGRLGTVAALAILFVVGARGGEFIH